MDDHILSKILAKMFLVLVKYIPIFVAFIIIVHVIMLLLNINDFMLDHIIRPDLISFIFTICASYLFKFCWIHRLFIGYDYLISFEMTWHEKVGLYNTLYIHRIGAVCIGLAVFVVLIINFKSFNNCCNYERKRILSSWS